VRGDVVAVGHYAQPILRRIVTDLKYRSATCLVSSIRVLVRRFQTERIGSWPWAQEYMLTICGMPSDVTRIRERGIDHITHLVDIVHEELVPWALRRDLLQRTRHVGQNAALPANELRRANVHGIFAVCTTKPVLGAVLLVDDVYTTGASWQEAARTLRAAGASKVYGFVYARGENTGHRRSY